VVGPAIHVFPVWIKHARSEASKSYTELRKVPTRFEREDRIGRSAQEHGHRNASCPTPRAIRANRSSGLGIADQLRRLLACCIGAVCPRKPGQEHSMRDRIRLRRLLPRVLLAAGLFALAGQRASADDLATIKQRGTLVVGVKADYPPFGFRSPSGEIVGIEPALAADVAKHLGVKLQLVPVAASNRIELLQQGKIDLIIATMNDTKQRSSAVDIVKPYYYAAGYNVMVAKSMNLKSWTELKGKPVCGIQGAYFNYEAAMNFGLQVIALPGPAEALTALQQGRCMGLLYDDTSIEGDMLQSEWQDYDMPLASQEVQPWALAVRRDQPEWAAYLSNIVKQWEKDGTILDLETKYHIKHSKFAEDAHQKASASSGN
jgi:polar amino acid transport system substrate-binding protein